MSQHAHFEAVLLRVVNYSERDRIVTFLARGVGKQSAFAPGARRSQRRFPGGLELFRLYDLVVRHKNASGGMGTLLEAHTSRSLSELSGSLEHIACASCALELVRELLQDDDPQDEVLDALWYFLETLNALPPQDTERMHLALRWLELRLLDSQGLAPTFDRCLRCMSSLEPHPHVFFSATSGGMLCPSCVEPTDRAQRIAQPHALLAGLTRLASEPQLTALLERARDRRSASPERSLQRFVRNAARINKQLIQNAVSAPLKAYGFLDALPTTAAPDPEPLNSSR